MIELIVPLKITWYIEQLNRFWFPRINEVILAKAPSM